MSTEAILKLANWLSPSFPVGAFAYSHGLEWAIHTGDVSDEGSTKNWVKTCLIHGTARTDAILLVQTMRGGDVQELDDLARALAASKERSLETHAQGEAFSLAMAGAWAGDPTPRAYPIAVGLAARAHDCPMQETVSLYLQAFVSNLVSAAIRLVPIGQVQGQRIIAALMPTITALTEDAVNASLDDIGGCAMLSDIASMRHETQTVRLFRT